MTIQLVKATYISGVLEAAASQHTLDAADEAYLVNTGIATYVGVGPDYSGNEFVKANVVGNHGSASANYRAIQAAVNAGGTINIQAAQGTVIDIDQTILVPSNTTIMLADGITLRKTGTISTQVFSNSDKVNGNVNIAIIGNATLDGNNAGVTGVLSNITVWNVVNMVNVDGLVISGLSHGPLTIKDAYKYLLFAGKVKNFRFCDLNLMSDNLDSSGLGRDGIHLAGMSSHGVIERCYGATSDDFIAINPRAVPLYPNETYGVAMGPIKSLVIRDIYGNVRDRSGNVVALYSGTFDDAAQTVMDGDTTSTSPTSTKPAIVSITQTGGVATVTTNKPHLMVQGDPFKIASSNPVAYNADFGYVKTVPTPTSFTYAVHTGAGAYVGSAVLTIYWQLDDVTVENVRGNTFNSSVLALALTPGDGQVGGLLRGIKISGVSGAADDTQSVASNTAVMSWTSVALMDSEIRGLSTTEPEWMRTINTINTSGKDACRTLGRVTIGGLSVKNNSLVNQTTGQGPIFLVAGKYEGLVLENIAHSFAINSGSWTEGILLSMTAGSNVTIRDSSVRCAHTTAGGKLLVIKQMDSTCSVLLDNCVAEGAVESIADIKDGAPVTGGLVVVSGGAVSSSALSAITCYGNAITVILENGFRSLCSATPVSFLGTAANCVLKVGDSVSHASAASATITGTGPYSISGIGAKIDVANAKVNRVDGVLLYNTNAAAGTLGAAGLVVGQGTSSNSWHLLADPTKVY
jgi:hypothetical protein